MFSARSAVFSLLVFSAFFYASWDSRYYLLLLFIAIQDHTAIRLLVRDRFPKTLILLWVLVVDLGILAFFKYFFFFGETVGSLASLWGWDLTSVNLYGLRWVLPLGISFFTFQSISAVVDAYRGGFRDSPPRFWEYLSYLSFFPQLVAGPIVHLKNFLPQWRNVSRSGGVGIPWKTAVFFLLMGYGKKTWIADRLATIVDPIFGNPDLFSSFGLWLGAFSYSLQIYCDFSGYSDIAIGLGLLLGIRLPENFFFPYLATGFGDFWRRWHITLSQWLRDYLYIPLGGSRQSLPSTLQNLVLTMVLGGLWHGANWTFLIWGFLHGLLLAVERLWDRFWGERILPKTGIFWGFRVAFVFLTITLLWVFFRAQNLTVAMDYLSGLFLPRSGLSIGAGNESKLVQIVVVVAVSHWLGKMYFFPERTDLVKDLGKVQSVPIYGWMAVAFSVLVLVLGSEKGQPFLYFVF